jgi:hypothetical protein
MGLRQIRKVLSKVSPGSLFSDAAGLDTRVNGYPVLLDFRKRVAYSSYTLITVEGVALHG